MTRKVEYLDNDVTSAALAARQTRPLGATDRRQLIRGSMLTALGLFLGLNRFCASWLHAAPQSGRLLGLVHFDDENIAPAATQIGEELDGRLYTDLSRVSASRLLTPVSEFYVRTASSRLQPDPAAWKILVSDREGQTTGLNVQTLRNAARPMGTHLMECAGNVRLTRFGLISAADWSGVPIEEVLNRAKVAGSSWIEITGFDEYAGQSASSIPGASWMFSMEALRQGHAFLATGMNGQPLTRNHGAPVRLVVPGWYGCACIKWVNRIAPVAEDAEASSQMREYAIRTLQQSVPRMARDFEPATIDSAAMPVRIEKWLVDGKLRYRVVGILWGGSELVRAMQIRFNPDQEWVRVEGFRQVKTDPWTVWTHSWIPRAPGPYTIRLAITDPPVRARKLNMGLYDRTVNIGET